MRYYGYLTKITFQLYYTHINSISELQHSNRVKCSSRTLATSVCPYLGYLLFVIFDIRMCSQGSKSPSGVSDTSYFSRKTFIKNLF